MFRNKENPHKPISSPAALTEQTYIDLIFKILASSNCILKGLHVFGTESQGWMFNPYEKSRHEKALQRSQIPMKKKHFRKYEFMHLLENKMWPIQLACCWQKRLKKANVIGCRFFFIYLLFIMPYKKIP